MERYDDEDSFVNLINRNKAIEEDAILTQEEIARNVDVFSTQIKTTNDRMKFINERKKYVERKDMIKRLIIAGSIVGTLITGLAIKVNYSDDIAAYFQKQEDISEVKSKLRTKAMIELLRYDLAISDSSSYQVYTVRNNTVDSYKILGISNFEDVYIYRTILPEEEFNKFIKAVSYVDENGTHYYRDYQQFLDINGYFDYKDFENAAEIKLAEMHVEYVSPKGAK